MRIFFLCLLSLFWMVPVSAKTARYEARGAGMHLMDAVVEYQLQNPLYQIQITTQTRGILSVLLDAHTVFDAMGQKKSDWQIDRAKTVITGRKKKTRHLDFSDRAGQLDYATLLLDNLLAPQTDSRAYTVFDGKRTLRVTFAYQGQVDSSELNLMPHEKLAYYTVSVEVIAGKKKGWFFNRMEDKEDSPLHLYFRPNEDGESTLVYAAFDTALLGQITIRHLPE